MAQTLVPTYFHTHDSGPDTQPLFYTDKKLERQTVSRDHKLKKQINVFVISQIFINWDNKTVSNCHVLARPQVEAIVLACLTDGDDLDEILLTMEQLLKQLAHWGKNKIQMVKYDSFKKGVWVSVLSCRVISVLDCNVCATKIACAMDSSYSHWMTLASLFLCIWCTSAS